MKTICFDVSNLAIRNLFGPGVLTLDPSNSKKVESVDYDLFRYRMFDSIYKSTLKVSGTREVVLAMDDKRSWRKIYWPKYKAHRKESRDRLDLDWDTFFATYEGFMTEMRNHFPFKVIKIKDSEADDVIGALVVEKPQEFHIISTDKDFLQLSSSRVKIYNPLQKKYVEHPNPELFIVGECMCGQAKDNIYNVKTPLDWPDDKRKPGFGEAAFEKVIAYGWKKWLKDNNLEERFEFNRNLMDFNRIPQTIRKRIMKEYDGYVKPHPDNIYEFFKKYQWPEYIDSFTAVENRIMEFY